MRWRQYALDQMKYFSSLIKLRGDLLYGTLAAVLIGLSIIASLESRISYENYSVILNRNINPQKKMFRPRFSGEYKLRIEFENPRIIDSPCISGAKIIIGARNHIDCVASESNYTLNWRLIDSNGIVRGDSVKTGGVADGFPLGRNIGDIKLLSGQRYTIQASIMGGDDQLYSMVPIFRIAPDVYWSEDRAIKYALLMLVSAISALGVSVVSILRIVRR